MIKNCYIRVDANETIGIGHLIRTEIIADKLAENGINIIFLCQTIPDTYISKLILKNYSVKKIKQNKIELPQITDIINNTENNLLITDSDIDEFYTKEFQLGIKKTRTKLMIITFYNQFHIFADLVLNQNIMALSQDYSSENYTVKLLGLENLILKDDYREISKNLTEFKTKLKNKTVLITFGGVDIPNRTKTVYKLLNKINNKPDKIIIVLGLMYKYRKEIENMVESSKINTEIYQNTSKMPYILAESDIVFNSGGLSVWEAGALKSLNVIIGYTNREITGGKFLHEKGFAYYLGTDNNLSFPLIAKETNKLMETDHSHIINNLYLKINVNGVYNVVQNILNL